MATSNILGLFTSPEQYQAQQLAQQQANEQQRAINFAGLDPRGQAVYGTFLGAQQLGRGFGGLLGVQDPQLQRIRQRDQLMQSINPADPESLMAGIQAATNAGDQEFAMNLATYLREAEGNIALTAQRRAAANREQQQAVPADIAKARELGVLTTALAELEKTPVGTPGREQQISLLKTQIEALKPTAKAGEQIKELVIADEVVKLEELLRTAKPDSTEAKNAKIKLDLLKGTKKDQNQIKELVIADEIVKLDKTIRDNLGKPDTPEVLDAKSKVAVLRSQLKSDKPNLTVVGEVKSGPDKGKAVYVDENKDEQFVYEFKDGKQVRKPFVGDVDRLTSQVTATATSSAKLPAGVDEVVRGLGKLDVDDMKTIRENQRTARASNASLKKLSELNDAGLISGAFASGRVGVSNFLNTIGVLSSADKNRLATSQQYEKVGADLVFQSLQGKLGPGVSEGDRLFIERLFPRLETDPAARRELINYLANKNNALINEGNRAEKWLRDNKSFEGYTPSVEGLFYAPSAGTARTMTAAELDAAIKAKKGGGK
jgi:hypothetical protein